MKPHICPVCNGTGLVKKDFYPDNFIKSNSTSTAYPTPDTYVSCRTCKGSGVLWYPTIGNEEKGTENIAPGTWSRDDRFERTNKSPILNDGFLGKVGD